MKVYVVNWNGGPTMTECLNSTYCVCDSLEKAQQAVFSYITEWKDTLLETDLNLTSQSYYTAKGTWTIERMELNDTGL